MPNFNDIKRRQFLKMGSLFIGTSLLTSCLNQGSQPSSSTSQGSQPSPSKSNGKLDKIKVGLSWKAEAEYGGFYQALATGIYRDYGFDVEIRPLPPQGNVTQLLMGDLVDFSIGQAVNALQAADQGIPKVTVAAIFQNEIQAFLAHPGVGNDSLAQLKGKRVFIVPGLSSIYWPFLEQQYGYTQDQQRPYNFNVTPFLLDKNSVQQGLLTSEPFLIEKEGGFKPVILLLSETGLNPYNFTLETTHKLIDSKPELVHRFVDASMKGWYSYLENPALGNELIQQDNSEMSDELLAFALGKIAEYDLIKSGDAQTLGIGAMTDERWKTLFDQLLTAGVVQDKPSYKDAYTLEFINKGVDYYLA
ncbi:ABC transporter substrate-binding protein [Laspinema olomoucense]|uniref:ABC transporter substrate-binding protein n=1 Tax=Laspinema olomoucense TaxID=3231600 RepID=UPI0021BABF59|nr:ABC transporter substrate-binding protein [Laspinema sp. D3c]MCT7992944.1 ABC transporter substrate-binding protein [Laspinema sp. D3c]